MRVVLNHLNKYCKVTNVKKTLNANVQKPQSRIIVDPNSFRSTGILAPLYHKFKNSNSLFEAKRNVDGFTPSQFQADSLESYKKVCEYYEQKNYREMHNYISQSLYKNFKSQCKSLPKSQPLNLGWRLIPLANKAKIVQIRVHTEKLSQLKISDRWFQIICQFKNEKGDQVYNVLEKHEKNKAFKFVKFDI